MHVCIWKFRPDSLSSYNLRCKTNILDGCRLFEHIKFCPCNMHVVLHSIFIVATIDAAYELHITLVKT